VGIDITNNMLDAVSENLRFHGQVYGNVQAQFHGILTITNNMMVGCDLPISTIVGLSVAYIGMGYQRDEYWIDHHQYDQYDSWVCPKKVKLFIYGNCDRNHDEPATIKFRATMGHPIFRQTWTQVVKIGNKQEAPIIYVRPTQDA